MHTELKEENLQLARFRELDQIFYRHKQHHPQIAHSTAKERIAKLKKMLHWILSHDTEIQQAVYSDFGKSAAEVNLSEILVVTSEIRHAIKNLKKWMRARKAAPTLATLTTKSWIQPEPKGVVLIIAPWNFPFNLCAGPLVSAIAAGNCAVLRPSEYAPATRDIVEKMVVELFPQDEVSVVKGPLEEAVYLTALPFDHIFFTGSPAVGKKVMAAAAENLCSVTLELGGKSPAIITENADVADAAAKIAWGKFLNAGQTCIAPDFILVQENIREAFLKAVQENIRKFYYPAGNEKSAEITGIINPRHLQRLTDLLSDAQNNGSEIICGGGADAENCRLEPTVLSLPLKSSARLMREEIFGPILPVLSYRNLNEVFTLLKGQPKPLACYVFSGNKKEVRQILQNTTSGNATVNEVLLQFFQPNLPFGGINNSGLGNAHGYFGFKAFSNERAVLKHHKFSPLKFLYPPYTAGVKKLIQLALKYL